MMMMEGDYADQGDEMFEEGLACPPLEDFAFDFDAGALYASSSSSGTGKSSMMNVNLDSFFHGILEDEKVDEKGSSASTYGDLDDEEEEEETAVPRCISRLKEGPLDDDIFHGIEFRDKDDDFLKKQQQRPCTRFPRTACGAMKKRNGKELRKLLQVYKPTPSFNAESLQTLRSSWEKDQDSKKVKPEEEEEEEATDISDDEDEDILEKMAQQTCTRYRFTAAASAPMKKRNGKELRISIELYNPSRPYILEGLSSFRRNSESPSVQQQQQVEEKEKKEKEQKDQMMMKSCGVVLALKAPQQLKSVKNLSNTQKEEKEQQKKIETMKSVMNKSSSSPTSKDDGSKYSNNETKLESAGKRIRDSYEHIHDRKAKRQLTVIDPPPQPLRSKKNGTCKSRVLSTLKKKTAAAHRPNYKLYKNYA